MSWQPLGKLQKPPQPLVIPLTQFVDDIAGEILEGEFPAEASLFTLAQDDLVQVHGSERAESRKASSISGVPRLMNIHPSLLPAFPGLHTHRRALAEGVRIHGCTVHFVTPTLDHGPVIIQAAVPVLDSDDEATLAARVLRQEHRIYPQAVRWFAEDRLRLDGGRVRLAAEPSAGGVLVAPEVR